MMPILAWMRLPALLTDPAWAGNASTLPITAWFPRLRWRYAAASAVSSAGLGSRVVAYEMS